MLKEFSPTPIPKTVSVHTLGCRLNFFETDGMVSVLKSNGYRIAETNEAPGHIIVNTCTVTSRADVKNRNIIRSAIKKYPGARVWVTGCYAQTDREILENIPGVAGVLGNDEKSSLPYRIMANEANAENAEIAGNIQKVKSMSLNRFAYSDVLPEGHTRAYLKIQDGCNRKCSYCKIPQARGLGVSREYTDVLDQVKFLQDSGIGEIVLTGVNLGWYRNNENQKSFIPLLEDILNALDYSRLRLSSIEPPDVGNDLADMLSHPRFCNFVHVPIQSGSRKILKDMKRTYNPESFRKRIELVKSKNPEIFLGTDVIAGFPGEEESEFNETIDLLRELEFHRVHAFPYSVRAKTSAEEMGDSIPKEIKKQRVLKLMDFSKSRTESYIESQRGKVLEAILESDNQLITDNYIRGRLREEDRNSLLNPGQFLDVIVEKILIEKENPIALFKLIDS
ncbi:MAG: tRNA (N(6)-L-threonylcarbamoyladenosine(37)-C(2))-methylthiotransferase MtaB [Leptospira sp.]|nr:tRNA (N(6)-L-threonylcarbamoyladenosine(37)-C(2))-methylthiotransferase MtaB [Leptospira sp.]